MYRGTQNKRVIWGIINETEERGLSPLFVNKKGKNYFLFTAYAKYYTIEFNENRSILSGQPGIESITKQYLYQLAYRDFLRLNRVEHIGNCFLMPSKEVHIVYKGFVSLSMFHQIPVNPELGACPDTGLSSSGGYDV